MPPSIKTTGGASLEICAGERDQLAHRSRSPHRLALGKRRSDRVQVAAPALCAAPTTCKLEFGLPGQALEAGPCWFLPKSHLRVLL